MKVLIHVLIIGFLLSVQTARAQVKLHVLSRTYQKEVNAEGLRKLQITAERAEIEIKTSAGTAIRYEIKLTAKHPDKEQARKDLDAFKLLSEKIGKQYYLRNYLQVDKGQAKPESGFWASYIITVPQEMALEVYNTFGKVGLSETSQATQVNVRFCETRTENTKSTLDIRSYFGSNKIINHSGNLILNADHSATELSGNTGISAKLSYGSILLNCDLKGNLSSENTDIDIPVEKLLTGSLSLDYDDVKLNIDKKRLDFQELKNKLIIGKATAFLEIKMKGGTFKTSTL